MPSLVWDKVSDRNYENGLDRGVLYLPDGSAVPWNGLTSIIEKFDKESTSVYYDGMKINELVSLGTFSATMKAITYPEEFTEIEGTAKFRPGMFLNDQVPKMFGLSYRTQVGNALAGETVGYKIHILYNLTAIPSDKTYASITEDPNLVEFEWNITAVPEEIPGFRPTSHITINSNEVDPWLLEELEAILYGDSGAFAALIPMPELIVYMRDWCRVRIIDNGDGTWTAIAMRDGFIQYLADENFEIDHINANYLNDYTYVISNTTDIVDVPQILIALNSDGTWSATTEHEGLITVNVDGLFEILNANAEFLDSGSYRISDTIEE